MKMKTFTVAPEQASFSPGKVIISGEHTVVYGHPAIVAALDVGIYAWVSEKKIESNYSKELIAYLDSVVQLIVEKYKVTVSVDQIQLHSEIQIGVGLGSSAAYAHAVVLAVLKHFKVKVSEDEIFKLVFEAEKNIHVNPSGVDPSAVVFGGVQMFQKSPNNNGYQKRFLKLARPYSFLLINSGTASETTGEMVTELAKRVKSSEKYRNAIEKIGVITQKIATELKTGSFSGDLLQKNNDLLNQLGIVGERAQEIILSVNDLGYQAKISGAGGIATGSGMILCYNSSENYNSLEEFCRERSLEYIKSTLK